MEVVEGLIPHGRQVVALQQVQDQQGGQALGVGGRFVNRVAAILRGDGFSPGGLVVLKVFLGQETAVLPAEAGDLPADLSPVENVSSLPGDLFQRTGQAGIGQQVPRTGTLSPGKEKALRGGKAGEFGLRLVYLKAKNVANGVSLAGVADGGVENRGHRQFSVASMGLEPAVHGSGDGDGQESADGHGVHSRLFIPIDAGGVGRAPAGVQKSQVFFGGIVNKPEGVPADAAHVGVDHVEDGIGGNGRIHRRPPLFQNIDSGLRREIMGGGHHPVGGHG